MQFVILQIPIPDESSLGATFAFLYDGHRNTLIRAISPARGDVLLFKSTVLHGAYPTRENKRVFVVDYFP